MYDNDQVSFSLVLTTGVESVYTPTEQETDEFELIDDDYGSKNSRWGVSSSESTSVSPSILDHEQEHGRRYHSYMSGRYPLPNDVREQHREDMMHALMLELTVSYLFSLALSVTEVA